MRVLCFFGVWPSFDLAPQAVRTRADGCAECLRERRGQSVCTRGRLLCAGQGWDTVSFGPLAGQEKVVPLATIVFAFPQKKKKKDSPFSVAGRYAQQPIPPIFLFFVACGAILMDDR